MEQISLVKSKPWSGRPKVKLARIGPCSLFHRAEGPWKHAAACEREEHTTAFHFDSTGIVAAKAKVAEAEENVRKIAELPEGEQAAALKATGASLETTKKGVETARTDAMKKAVAAAETARNKFAAEMNPAIREKIAAHRREAALA